jgi:hypothetical protein
MISSWFFFWNSFYIMYVQNLSLILHKKSLYIYIYIRNDTSRL